jgi:hypothetical protein
MNMRIWLDAYYTVVYALCDIDVLAPSQIGRAIYKEIP